MKVLALALLPWLEWRTWAGRGWREDGGGKEVGCSLPPSASEAIVLGCVDPPAVAVIGRSPWPGLVPGREKSFASSQRRPDWPRLGVGVL